MKNNKRILALLILFAAVAMFSILPATAAVANTPQKCPTMDDGIQVEAKYKKVSTNKITWNGNGGKIGSKIAVTTNIKKGTMIKILPTTPKRTGYTFKGWYTKKTGGIKINKNTKVSKNVIYYAQWKKGTSTGNTGSNRALNAEEKRLVGKWSLSWDGSSSYQFNADGTYLKVSLFSDYDWGFKGYYNVKNGKITLRYQNAKDYTGVGFSSKSLIWKDWETTAPMTLELYTNDGKQYMKIDNGLSYRKVS
jgi:uncharacterized repeat protein (TIGR02543 family)